MVAVPALRRFVGYYESDAVRRAGQGCCGSHETGCGG